MLVGLVSLFGLVVGSFLNVCITRLPPGESVVAPGSRCRSCRTPIPWFDNIPVISYLALRGRCRNCGAAIGLRYPVVEVATAALFAVAAWQLPPDSLVLGKGLLLTSLLIVLFGTDLDVRRLPDVITLPGMAAGLLFGIWTAPGLVNALAGAAIGAGVLLLIRWSWARLAGVEGMGLGDVKMLAMIGAFLGWTQVGVVLFLASLAGAVVGLALAGMRGRSLRARLPFGCFLAVAAYLALLVGPAMLEWYLSLYV